MVRDHVKAKLLQDLPLSVGRDLKAFGVLTRKDEPLSEIASEFVAHLRRTASSIGGEHSQTEVA